MTQIVPGLPPLSPELRATVPLLQAGAGIAEEAVAPGGRVHHIWDEVTSGELFASALHLSPDRIRRASEMARDVGNALKDVWKNLEDSVRKALDLPAIEHAVSPEDRERIASIARNVGMGVGLAGAGVLGAAGIYKLVAGIRRHERGGVLDGLVDLTAGAAVAASVAAVGPLGLVLGPLAATVGVARGGYNAWRGYRQGASRPEIQGFLDAGNNSLAFARLLGKQAPALGAAALVLAPMAATVQLARGYWDLSTGIREHVNEKKVQGLADVASAVGLALAVCGPLAVPGVALVGLSSAAKVLYQFNGKARRRMDRAVDRMTPRLEKVMGRVETVVDPVVNRVRGLVERVTGVHRGEDPAPSEPTKVDESKVGDPTP